MLRYLVIFGALNAFIVTSLTNVGPKFPPTHGEVWPQPQMQMKHDQFLVYDPAKLVIKTVRETCPTLTRAINHYVYVLKKLHDIASKNRINHKEDKTHIPSNEHDKKKLLGNIMELNVELSAPCEDYPHFDMDEIYYLNVSSTSNLRSSSIWGILRGLETFSQLFFITDDFKVNLSLF
ncbi:beta-hexosaminidase subunit beta-like [Hyposmocoma kahamanoa]|uniref:beta-hexosaminidase subunit beta-like n=1 Tax=Hyposmocoma kahamanoa TaxID=1477025 RepID=UPI000E6D8341|nr:beta-hexosaminidase subunit beta-like [Hyposmocoma kahamanoa]